MKLHSNFSINGKIYEKGTEVPSLTIYLFFLLHMAVFGGSGFFMAYAKTQVPIFFLYLHGGFAILIYTIFYLSIFGVDEVKWMFINAGLGLFGIYTQIDWILALFGRNIRTYPLYVHVIPFLYFVLYTFLLRQFVLDLAGARDDPEKKKATEIYYVVGSTLFYVMLYLFLKRR